MKLGTMVYEEKIYNLDYMSSKEIEGLLEKVVTKRKQNIIQGKRALEKNI